ncbi:hypothetical protein [Rheinheimera fenheensis]|uniref:hypothetical protein n=1 Tax=Rheinheimera fenheensis TaxID=3152295 RepID=UPI0032616F20
MLKLTLPLFALCLGLHTTLAQAEEPVSSGFIWDKWAQALNDSPCDWFDKPTWQQLLTTEYNASKTTSREATSCKFVSSDQTLLMTASIRSLADATAVNAERDGMLSQISQYGSGRFEQIPSGNNAVTAILRKDKLQLFVFANDNNEAAFILLSGHPVRNETPEQKALRKARLIKVAQAVFAQFQF